MPQSSSHFSSNPTLPMGHLSVTAPLTNIPSGMSPTQESLNRLQQLIDAIDSTLRLPNTPKSFAVYLLGLVIVFSGAFLHVLVAAQIMQAEFTLSQLEEEYRAIEQQNGDLIFQIARDTNMARLHQEIVKAGYVPVEDREYVFVPAALAASADAPAQTNAPLAAATPEQQAEIAAAAQPAVVTAPTTATSGNGQWARWQAFWRTSLGMTTGAVTSGAVTSGGTPTASAHTFATTLAPDASPNFWAVWWEQASEQGTKLLEQMRGQ